MLFFFKHHTALLTVISPLAEFVLLGWAVVYVKERLRREQEWGSAGLAIGP